jgi:hypothetical protein
MTCEKVYATRHGIVKPAEGVAATEFYIESVNIKTNVKLKEIVTISDPEILKFVDDHIEFPLEEYEYGLYKDSLTLKDIVNMTIDQMKSQKGVTTH